MTENFYDTFAIDSEIRRKRTKKTLLVFIIFMCLMITFCTLYFFFKTQRKKNYILGEEVYFVATASYDSIEYAQLKSNEIQIQGGAGTIYCKDKFYVIAFSYFKKNNAERVAQNLINNGILAEIIRIKFDKIYIKNIDNNAVACLKYLRKILDQLYEMAINLDTQKIEQARAFLEIEKISNKLSILSSSIEKSTEFQMFLLEKTNNLLHVIENFKSSSFQKNLFSSGVKNLCVCVAIMLSEISIN